MGLFLLFSTPAGSVLVDADVLDAHIQSDRTAYLPVLTDALTNPQDIWLRLEQHKGTGKVLSRTQFITVYQASVMVALNAERGVMAAWNIILEVCEPAADRPPAPY